MILIIIGVGFFIFNQEDNIPIQNVTDNIVKENITGTNNLTNQSVNIKETVNEDSVPTNINKKTRTKSKMEPILISKKEAIKITKSLLENFEDENSVSNHAKLITVGKKHYWVTKINNYKQYIDAKTGKTINPNLIEYNN